VAALVPDGVAAVIGFHEHGHYAAVAAAAGKPIHLHRKLYLVDYPPFDEHEQYGAGADLRAYDIAGARAATLICNDAWQPLLPFLAVQDGAEVLVMPSASSTAVPEAEEYWRELTRFHARMLQCYVVFVNRVGEEAGYCFWGGSHVVDPSGVVVAEAPRLEEALVHAEIDLEDVAARRLELPILREPRLDLVERELTRLAERRRNPLNS
jgi:predicted amidohydrolase